MLSLGNLFCLLGSQPAQGPSPSLATQPVCHRIKGGRVCSCKFGQDLDEGLSFNGVVKS